MFEKAEIELKNTGDFLFYLECNVSVIYFYS